MPRDALLTVTLHIRYKNNKNTEKSNAAIMLAQLQSNEV